MVNWNRRSLLVLLKIIAVIVTLALNIHNAHADKLNGPWGEGKCKHNTSNVKNVNYISFVSKIHLSAALWFWQKTISRIDGKECPMYPSCSHYAQEAIIIHGPIVGYFLTVDRMIHENSEIAYCQIIKVDGKLLYYDPVSNNDFWWYRKEKAKYEFRM
jgi:putative component of membrane protein insertase Oxa1/YidC/SpoIIIJ protein YidD